MANITVIWIAGTLFIGFATYLFPKLACWLALGVAVFSSGYAVQLFLLSSPLDIQLLDSFGVSLILDQLSGFFILTNALVTIAVILYCWQSVNLSSRGRDSHRFFYTQIIILHGSVNAAFISADFISLYVALEVISIAAFLLIAYSRTDRAIWSGLRYLFVSNTAMLFYLIGAVLVYQTHHSFSYSGLRGSPPEAIALIFLGLFVKGGVFILGFWSPLTYSESETAVSAMLSGIVGKAAIFPLVRCALLVEELSPVVKIFGVGSAVLGVLWAILERDTKRTLAFSSISQMGFILGAPAVGGFYALNHGIVKAALFLIEGVLPSSNFQELKELRLDTKLWFVLAIASCSISGFPLLAGFGAKVLTTENLLPWQVIVMNLTTIGTAIIFAKFIFLPHEKKPLLSSAIVEIDREQSVKELSPTEISGEKEQKISAGFWWAIAFLLSGLIAANSYYYEAYTLRNVVKSLLIIFVGWLGYWLIFKNLAIKLPRENEKLDHLIGLMSLMLILLLWKISMQLPTAAVWK
ncbi:MAG: cation:proton antiporter [Cyanobacteria bacterium P01_E01_bin.35]